MNSCANSASLLMETPVHREGLWKLVIGPVCRDNMTTAVKLNIEGRDAVALLGRALANRGGCGTMAWVLPDGDAVGVGGIDSRGGFDG
jgi:hypothetical protein